MEFYTFIYSTVCSRAGNVGTNQPGKVYLSNQVFCVRTQPVHMPHWLLIGNPLLGLYLLPTKMRRSRGTRLLRGWAFLPSGTGANPACRATPSWCSVGRKRIERSLAWQRLGGNWKLCSASRRPAFCNICFVSLFSMVFREAPQQCC